MLRKSLILHVFRMARIHEQLFSRSFPANLHVCFARNVAPKGRKLVATGEARRPPFMAGSSENPGKIRKRNSPPAGVEEASIVRAIPSPLPGRVARGPLSTGS